MKTRVLGFVAATLLLTVGAWIVYGIRTGQLKIFADVPVQPSRVTIASDVDLAKGIPTGDGNLEQAGDVLSLKKTGTGYAPSGTCRYDIGSPQVIQFFRFQTIPGKALPEGTGISLTFAGSLDGITFDTASPPIALLTDQTTSQSFDLTQYIPETARFLRVGCTLTTNDPSQTPTFSGFSLDFDGLPSTDGQTSVANGSLIFTIEPDLGKAPLSVTTTYKGAETTGLRWDFGDGTPIVENGAPIQHHEYREPGQYTASLTIGNRSGTFPVHVTEEQVIQTRLLLTPSSAQPGESIQISLANNGLADIVTGTKPIAIYSSLGEQVYESPEEPSHVITPNTTKAWTWNQRRSDGQLVAPGAYWICVGVRESKSACVATASITIAEVVQPVAMSVTPSEGQIPLAITGEFQGPDDTIWDFGDGIITFSSSVNHTYERAGTYQMTVRSGNQVGTKTILATVQGVAFGESSGIPVLVNGTLPGDVEKKPLGALANRTTSLLSSGLTPVELSLIAFWAILIAALLVLGFRRKKQ